MVIKLREPTDQVLAEWRTNSESVMWFPCTEKMTRAQINGINRFYGWQKMRPRKVDNADTATNG